MWDVLLLFSSICTAVVVGAPDTVTGHRGERVEIRCPYEPGYESNVKYFCKGECIIGFTNIMVESGSPGKDERFSLTDDTTNRVFTVTITDLRTEDEGQYWCGVEKTGPDVLSEIMLLVKYAVVVGAPDTVTGHRGERVEIRCPYEPGYESNVKYFCKGECIFGNRNFMVKSGSPAKDERFSLTDDTTNRVFTVTITDLRTEDEGQYWCGVEKTGPDVLSEIMLLVKYAVVVGAPDTVTGHRGERVEIRCSYQSGYEFNSKYFCKGQCQYIGNKDIMVKSGFPAKDERFSLTDDKKNRVFTVTITDLRTEDEGQYWCAVRRTLTDVFSEIILLVKQKEKATEVSTISSFSVRSESEMNPSSRITDHRISSTDSVGINTAEALVYTDYRVCMKEKEE
ncbi:polymeric immunoglobulin receptor-like isoform X2 [Megalobrama amblycephala]|uniref:polymeric immunoglobulin receptor-like isoform X2 n=1 Tax=Megalobrama amblycephala TaxID=75352 RepID=UPI002013C889|nr:polymeric immunoglobulin receptor-like isoform X2 [Megalobrama amblycephala]